MGLERGVMCLRKIVLLTCFMTLFFCSVCSASLVPGMRGELVKQTQERLMIFGYDIGEPDGIYGDRMVAIVKKYQGENNLPVTGEIDKETFSRLMGDDLPNRFGSGSISFIRNIIGTAMALQGVPYVFGGTSPGGFDCSGFVQYVFRNAGIQIPRMADEQYYASRKTAVPREGDLVFFTTYMPGVSHVGIYIGGDNFVHASSSRGVTVSSLKDSYWAPRYVGAGAAM